MPTSTVDGNKAPELFALLCSSLVVLVVALVAADSMPLYTLLFGAVSSVLSLVMLTVQVWKSEILDRTLFKLPKAGDVNLGFILACFLFGWWSVGAGLCTFRGPFTTLSNGYLGCWASLAASMVLIAECKLHPDEHIKRRPQMRDGKPVTVMVPVPKSGVPGGTKAMQVQVGLLICAIAVILSAVQSFSDVPDFSGGWASANTSAPAATYEDVEGGWEAVLVVILACPVIAAMVVLLIGGGALAMNGYVLAPFITTLACLILWSALVVVATFRAPFLTAGNGYFSSWLGLVLAAQAVRPHLPESWKRRMSGLRQKLAAGLKLDDADPDGAAAPRAASTAAPGGGADGTAGGGPSHSGSDGGVGNRKAVSADPEAAEPRSTHPPTDYGPAFTPAPPRGTVGAAALSDESRLLPLIDALGEVRAERDRLSRELAARPGAAASAAGPSSTFSAEAEAELAEVEAELAEAREELSKQRAESDRLIDAAEEARARAEDALAAANARAHEAEANSAAGRKQQEEAEARQREAEGAIADLERELSDALAAQAEAEDRVSALEEEAKTNHGSSGGVDSSRVSREELETALADRDDALDERDAAREAQARAEAALAEAKAEIDEIKEKEKARAEEGRARLANRKAAVAAKRGGGGGGGGGEESSGGRVTSPPPEAAEMAPTPSSAAAESGRPRRPRRGPDDESSPPPRARNAGARRQPRDEARREELGRNEEGTSSKARPPRSEVRRRRTLDADDELDA